MNDPVQDCTHALFRMFRGAKRMSADQLKVEPGIPALDNPALATLRQVTEYGPARPSAIADLVHVDLSTASRQLAALEKSGWVARQPDQIDRRAQLVTVTDDGRKVLDANMAARRAKLAELMSDWTDDECHEFARLLNRLSDRLENKEHQP